jgi:uncharacterized RDD family membrane protein YckC
MSAQANPYAPPSATVADAIDEHGEMEIAGRGTRLGAYFLDVLASIVFSLPALIVGGFSFIAFFVANPTAEGMVQGMTEMLTGTFALLLFLGWAVWAVITIILVKRNGQTIGKKILGIKVVRKDGSPASLGRIFWLRNVVNALPSGIPAVGGLYFFIDSLFIFSESNQCVHDKIADTIVVRA